MSTSARASLSDRLSALLEQHRISSVQLVEAIAGSFRRAAPLFGFGPAATIAVSRDASLDALSGDLADLAAEWSDLSTLQDVLLAGCEPAGIRALWDSMHAPEQIAGGRSGADTTVAFYDLESGPVTYDFIQFLVLAEKFRRLNGNRHLQVVFVPGGHQGFRNRTERDHFLSEGRKEWRLVQLLMHACYLVPACVGVTRLRSRDEANAVLARTAAANVFPGGYSLANPICPYLLSFVVQFATPGPDIRTLRAPPLARALAQAYFRELAGETPVVTITLRQSDFQPQRNSRLDEWLAFAGRCRGRGYYPVFIPDTEAVLQGRSAALPGFPVFDLAALSIGIRAAAYEASWHNMMVNSGPYTLCLYDRSAGYSMFKLLVPDIMTTSAAFHVAQGTAPGTQVPFAGPRQRWVWEDDSLDAIEREFAGVEDLGPTRAGHGGAAA